MYRPAEYYVSPSMGEFTPKTNADELVDAFHDIAHNRIIVPGEVIRADDVDDTPMRRLDVVPEHGIYMNVHPQTLHITQDTAQTLEGLMADWFRHYPEEPTYARREHGVPMVLTRFDGIIRPDGEIGLCEFDDVPTMFSALRGINPVAASYVDAAADQLGAPLYSAFLPEEGYVYPHDDHLWLPSTGDAPLPEVAVIPRARRSHPDFGRFMDQWGEQSAVAAWERDNKGPLAAMDMGVLAANLTVALEVGERLKGERPVVLKGLKSSRTEAAGVMAASRFKIRGSASPGQLARKFAGAGIDLQEDRTMVLQPFYKPPTMDELGLKFRDGDSATMAAADARNSTAAELVKPGNEGKYHVLSRIYGVYLPGENADAKGRHVIIGGFWMARPNAAIIHGASDAIVGKMEVDGLERYAA
ncbi:MAG TPA: hypothetical protein VJM32_06270 [Candidatus Saccharimonadales bacterium]|nr:hypothetical protein [Candidatus Saccharimonadales bacterium]